MFCLLHDVSHRRVLSALSLTALYDGAAESLKSIFRQRSVQHCSARIVEQSLQLVRLVHDYLTVGITLTIRIMKLDNYYYLFINIA